MQIGPGKVATSAFEVYGFVCFKTTESLVIPVVWVINNTLQSRQQARYSM